MRKFNAIKNAVNFGKGKNMKESNRHLSHAIDIKAVDNDQRVSFTYNGKIRTGVVAENIPNARRGWLTIRLDNRDADDQGTGWKSFSWRHVTNFTNWATVCGCAKCTG